ncbi:MAG TPA: ABC transporter permease [Bryobacteraceae bacterium]
MTGLRQDLRYSARMLAKTPGFAIVSLLTLALGIGANTAIFSFVDAVFLKPLPYPDADRIVFVLEKTPQRERYVISTLDYLDWKKQTDVFESMTAFAGGVVTLTGMGEPVQLRRGSVAPEYFKIFGVHAALGRTLAAGEDQPGKNHVVVLSHVLWQRQFGGDPKIIGKSIRLDGEPYTVVGVLPARRLVRPVIRAILYAAGVQTGGDDAQLPLVFRVRKAEVRRHAGGRAKGDGRD